MHAWILALLISLAPPGRVPSRETAEAGLERYGEIALAIETVAMTEEPLFLGDRGRERTAALLVSVAFFESGLRRDVDEGTTRGDHGRACGLWQIQGAGVPCPELTADRANEAAIALALMRRFVRSLPRRARLATPRCIRVRVVRRWTRGVGSPDRPRSKALRAEPTTVTLLLEDVIGAALVVVLLAWALRGRPRLDDFVLAVVVVVVAFAIGLDAP